MRIAQLVPTPSDHAPGVYSRTEIVRWLAEDLSAGGHELSIFCEEPGEVFAGPAWRVQPLGEIDRLRGDFDLIHSHGDLLCLRFDCHRDPPVLTTCHGRLDPRRLHAAYLDARGHPFVSISQAQRAAVPFLQWLATIPPGLPPEFRLCEAPDGHLVCVGPMAPESGFHRAIEIANEAEIPLRLVSTPGPVDAGYFQTAIRPRLAPERVDFAGELGREARARQLARADALLCPFDAPAPFDLVAIEALACGTPVIAIGPGAISELIDDGSTGFRVGSSEEAVDAVGRIGELSRRRCRRLFDRQLTIDCMSRDYEAVYRWIVAERRARRSPPDSQPPGRS